MLIKKALDTNIESYPLGTALQPARVDTIPGEIARMSAAPSLDNVNARRMRRQYRNYRQTGFRNGGWSLKAW